ncbi:hypothetical protein [Streptomyces boninensis]|uniref:hypothetical protein n=1 Tax=Streptomyces boninensis TaxID=2039455 RepID=UPI003B218C9B
MVGSLAGILVCTISACTDTEQYSIPEKFCNVALDPAKARSVLPTGRRLTQRDDSTQARLFCYVDVDERKNVLKIYVSRHPDKLNDPIWKDLVPPGFAMNDPRPAKAGDRAAVGRDGAVADVQCLGGRKALGKYLTVRLSLPWLEGEKPGEISRPEIEKFLDAYLKGQRRNHSC